MEQAIALLRFTMGTFLSVDASNRVLFVRFEGVLTDELLLKRYRQALEWNSVHRYESGIADCTGVDSTKLSSGAIRRIADHPPVIPKEIRRTVVLVAPQDVTFGLARMFQVLGSPTRDTAHVVRTMGEAYQLIGVASLDLQSVIE
jgi:hypothetical protein